MKNICHWRTLTIFLGIVFGVLSLLPTVCFYVGVSYRGIEMMPYDAELHYAARVREVVDGYPSVGNLFLPNKSLPYAQPALPEIVAASVGRLMGLDAARSLLVFDGVWATAVFIMLVLLFEEMVSDRRAALMGVVFVTFAGFLPGNSAWVISLFHGVVLPVQEGLPFARAVNPGWSVFWASLAMWAMVRWLKRQDRRMLWLIAGSFCILMYSYLYAWTVVGVLTVLTGWLSRRFLKNISFKQWAGLALFSVTALCPYLINLWQLTHHPLYSALAIRLGLVTTHRPALSITALVMLVTLLLFRQRIEALWAYLFALVITWGIVINQQVITGHFLQVGHYDWYFIKPFSLATVVALFSAWVYSRPWLIARSKLIKASGILFITGCVLLGTLYQLSTYRTQAPGWMNEQKGISVIQFFQHQGRPGEVIFAPTTLSDELAIYTDKNLYISSNHVAYLISTRELAERYFFEHWVSDEYWKLDWSSRQFRCEFGARLYTLYFTHVRGSCDAFTEAEKQEWSQAFIEFSALSLEQKLALHDLNYLVLPLTTPKQPWMLITKMVAADHDYVIYKR